MKYKRPCSFWKVLKGRYMLGWDAVLSYLHTIFSSPERAIYLLRPFKAKRPKVVSILQNFLMYVGLKSYAFVKHTLLFAKAVGFNPPYTKRLQLSSMLFLLLIILSTACQETNIPPPAAGQYGKHVILAYNESTQEISGIYKDEINTEETGDSCYFYFVGKLAGPKTNIISWRIGHRLDEVFGVLEIRDSTSFHFSLEKAHINCSAVQDFSAGAVWTHSQPKPWRYIRTVKAQGAAIYIQPEMTAAPLDTILPKGAILKILDKKIHWVKVEAGEVSGWMQEEDLIRFPG